jgi:hypothetical protein
MAWIDWYAVITALDTGLLPHPEGRNVFSESRPASPADTPSASATLSPASMSTAWT